MKRGITVSFPDEIIEAIEKCAAETKRTRSMIVNLAVEDWLKKQAGNLTN